MATLTERLDADYRTALKAGERLKVDTLRMIKAGMQRAAMDKRKDALTDEEVLQVLAQQAKQRKETIAAAQNRKDVLDQANQELAILNGYLPPQLSAEQLGKLIEEAVASVGLNQGQIMKHVMAKASGAADGKTVSQLVGERMKKGT